MSLPDVTAPIVLRSGYEPGVIGRIGELHGRYYAVAWGSGAAFEMQVLRGLCAFVEAYDSRTHLLLTAHAGETVIGSAAVQLFPPVRQAQLRLVIVDPAWHGRGAGRALLDAALAWCRARGVETCFLGRSRACRRRGRCASGPVSASSSASRTRATPCRASASAWSCRLAPRHWRSVGPQRADRRDRRGPARRQDGGDERRGAERADAGS